MIKILDTINTREANDLENILHVLWNEYSKELMASKIDTQVVILE